MSSKTLWILCGCPASGKSTWASNADGVRVSRDEIRFNMMSEDDEYFDKEEDVFKKFINELVQQLKENDNVYADATHINWNSRKKLINALKNNSEFDANISAVTFYTPLDVCLERNNKRVGRARVPNEVIQNMYHAFSSPKNDPFHYNEMKEIRYVK